jgi:hypothetical protein
MNNAQAKWVPAAVGVGSRVLGFLGTAWRWMSASRIFQATLGAWFLLPSADDVAEVGEKWKNFFGIITLLTIIIVFATPLKSMLNTLAKKLKRMLK